MKLCITPAKSCSHRTCRLVAYKEVHLLVVSSLKVVLKRVDQWCINVILGDCSICLWLVVRRNTFECCCGNNSSQISSCLCVDVSLAFWKKMWPWSGRQSFDHLEDLYQVGTVSSRLQWPVIHCTAAEHDELIKKKDSSWVKLKAFPTNIGQPKYIWKSQNYALSRKTIMYSN